MAGRSVIDAVRAIGRSLPDVEETTSWGAFALKVRGKMFVCSAINKQAEPNSLVVRMTNVIVGGSDSSMCIPGHALGVQGITST